MSRTGRPLKYENAIELEEKCQEYFDLCDEKGEEPMITGLALHLDTSRKTLMEYENREDKRPDLSNIIKKAKDVCEFFVEKRIIKRGNAGDIFNAKQYGFTDRQDVNLNHSGEIGLTDLLGVKRGKNNE